MKTYLSVTVASLLLVASHSSAYALIDLDVGGGARTNGASSSVQTNTSVNVNTSTSSSSGSTGTSGTSSGEFKTLNFTRSSVENETVVETMPEAVLTHTDLKAYATTALKGDENLEAFNFSEDKVEVSYKQRGRLLALVPISFTAKAIAKADGDVELDYPWYAFLTVDDHEKLRTELKVVVDNTLKARAVGSVRAEGEVMSPRFTASESAEVASEMHAVLRSGLNGEVK
jgi:hypothetical protein